MRLTPLKFTLLLILMVGCISFLNLRLNRGQVLDKAPLQNFRVSLFAWTSQFKAWVLAVPKLHLLSSENENLRKQNVTLINDLAKTEALTRENELLKKALHLSQQNGVGVIPGGVFELNLSPTGYQVLVNQGSRDQVKEGDPVITPEGVLVGKISQIYPNYSKLLYITDPGLSISVKVLNRSTTGIAKGQLGHGLKVDLILAEDEISEGDIVVTSGSDLLPPGLVVGKVRHVGQSGTELFKEVRVEPAVQATRVSRILIIKK